MYICTVCMHIKEPQKPPEHTSEHVKSWRHSPDPLTQSLAWAPLYIFALGSSNLLGGPAQQMRVMSALNVPMLFPHNLLILATLLPDSVSQLGRKLQSWETKFGNRKPGFKANANWCLLCFVMCVKCQLAQRTLATVPKTYEQLPFLCTLITTWVGEGALASLTCILEVPAFISYSIPAFQFIFQQLSHFCFLLSIATETSVQYSICRGIEVQYMHFR